MGRDGVIVDVDFKQQVTEVSEIHAPMMQDDPQMLRAKLEQARIVISRLLADAAAGAEGERALEYFSSGRYEPGFLPWPRQQVEGIRPEDLSAANDG